MFGVLCVSGIHNGLAMDRRTIRDAKEGTQNGQGHSRFSSYTAVMRRAYDNQAVEAYRKTGFPKKTRIVVDQENTQWRPVKYTESRHTGTNHYLLRLRCNYGQIFGKPMWRQERTFKANHHDFSGVEDKFTISDSLTSHGKKVVFGGIVLLGGVIACLNKFGWFGSRE